MKTPLFISLIFLLSCSEDVPELQLQSRADYITYNPSPGCVGQEVTVSFDNGYGNNCGTSKIQQFINEKWVTVEQDIPLHGMITHTFVPHLAGEYRFRASWNGNGKHCEYESIKFFEEDPLIVDVDCCRDYFTATAICNLDRPCQYGIEFHFKTSIDNWVALIGDLPSGYSFCGLYDEFGNIIENYSGSHLEISGDFYACYDVTFFVYFSTSEIPPSFGTWMLKDMQGVLYNVRPEPCLQ